MIASRVGKLDSVANSGAQNRLAVTEDVPGDAHARIKVDLLGVNQRGNGQAGTDLLGLPQAHWGRTCPSGSTVECGDPIYSQRMPGVRVILRSDAPSVLEEGGMPALTVLVGIVTEL